MKILKLTTLLIGLTLIFGTSCGKYEEGPGISFRSKKARVANEWIVDQYVYANGDVEKESESNILELTKDGGVTVIFSGGTLTGAWEFVKDKEEISFNFSGTTYKEKIVKLKNNDMWLEDSDGDQTHYVSK